MLEDQCFAPIVTNRDGEVIKTADNSFHESSAFEEDFDADFLFSPGVQKMRLEIPIARTIHGYLLKPLLGLNSGNPAFEDEAATTVF